MGRDIETVPPHCCSFAAVAGSGALVLAAQAYAQPSASPSQSVGAVSGSCNPITTTNMGEITINCPGISPDRLNEIVAIMTKLLDSRIDPKVLIGKIDDILNSLNSMDQREQKAQENLRRSSIEKFANADAQCPAFITQVKLRLDAFLREPVDRLSGMTKVPSLLELDLANPIHAAQIAISVIQTDPNLKFQQSDEDAFMKACSDTSSRKSGLGNSAVAYSAAFQQLDRLNDLSHRVSGDFYNDAQKKVASTRAAVQRDGDDLIISLQSICTLITNLNASLLERADKKSLPKQLPERYETSHVPR